MLLAIATRSGAAASPLRNVLLITIDDLRPQLNRLAIIHIAQHLHLCSRCAFAIGCQHLGAGSKPEHISRQVQHT